MDDNSSGEGGGRRSSVAAASHRKKTSAAFVSGSLPRASTTQFPTDTDILAEFDDDPSSIPGPGALSPDTQHHKTRRRRGSLRKAALLGRGVQREKQDGSPLAISALGLHSTDVESAPPMVESHPQKRFFPRHDALGLPINDPTPKPSADDYNGDSSIMNSSASSPTGAQIVPNLMGLDHGHPARYASTTDEEDGIHMSGNTLPLRSNSPASSGSDSYFASLGVTPGRRAFQQAKSPLSYSGLSAAPLPPPDSDWDYTETEWWGWVVLCVTWFVFVIGMGSCLNIWSWAWDVGTTPYAPPELEDDPTLPIVGYYPALIILTGVMAWVWVVAAWVGMKYFRHAKISGD